MSYNMNQVVEKFNIYS